MQRSSREELPSGRVPRIVYAYRYTVSGRVLLLYACAPLINGALIESMFGYTPGPSPHYDTAVSALSAAASRPDWQCLEDVDVPLKQQPLSAAIDEALHQHLLSTAPSIRARALALSSALPHAGNWLNGIPSSTLGLHLQDQEFRCCLRYWLGVPLHSSPYSCPECHNTADPFGDHHVGCGGNGDRITRHNAIRDVIFSAAQSAALAPSKEMPNLIPDSLSRPADVFLPTWSRGRPAALDVHVISPLQQQTMGEAASTPGHALQVGVQRKLASHLSACRSVGVEFIPFVMETLGYLAEDSIFNFLPLKEKARVMKPPMTPNTKPSIYMLLNER